MQSQRISILNAAEQLFLEKGIESTSMTDIAARARVSRQTLYRYFPERHPIAFEIAIRMLNQVANPSNASNRLMSIGAIGEITLGMIDQFHQKRDAYRYLGMFDHLYGDRYPNESLAAWYKEQIFAAFLGDGDHLTTEITPALRSKIAMVLNLTLSFLEKMAIRGDLMENEQEVPLDQQLLDLKELIQMYFNHLRKVQ
ncbi:MAG: helix-turn-helix transcriptional regulator [Anaerolineaceae bacterium]|nr:helix-turn-helix transcriptional regulator [Anaerolineaceae bacterium]